MPLLKRKAFEKSTASEYLRDDDEVFHCEITDEIFKNYEEYCERIILVNSMVWSCEMTGKNNFTYSEALSSERAARRSLKDFPMELRIPILYLAAKTNRSSFAEMSEDVFNYVRDKYFVGETVEACLDGDIWLEAHILSVTVLKQLPGSKVQLPASAYCYEVEQYHESDPSQAGQAGTAPHDRVRRRKGVYSRDKNRLFLKQFVQQGPTGIICIKDSAIVKYKIKNVSFDQIFTGDPPVFPSSKKLFKNSMSPAASTSQMSTGSATKLNKSIKKGRQESMDKFVKKTDKTEAPKKPVDPNALKSAQELAEKMRRAEDLMRQRKEEEKASKKEKTARLQAYIKEWQKVKDDLELEDHKVIPKGTPIDMEGIPQEHVGDVLAVLEFIYIYADVLKTKDVFHNQLDLETFRKALTMKEYAGTFSDLIQMLLTTIFTLQEDEAEDYNESKGIQLSTEIKELDSDIGVTKAVELATKASKWPQTYLGTPLSKLPLDPTTVSEVLRLHLLSSGGSGGARCASWRYQQRGGYTSHDDPALRLRLDAPALLRSLARAHVAQLPLDDKFQILHCLMNQILSYATVRDLIEERLEEMKNIKQSLRVAQINERKREAQLVVTRQELRKEAAAKKAEEKLTGEKAKDVDENLRVAIEKLMKDSESKKLEYEKKQKELQTQLFDYTSYIGMDRAFRRYWVNQIVSGLFVEATECWRGQCRDKPVVPSAQDSSDTVAYVTSLFHSLREPAGSDKENDSAANSRGNSPKKPFASLNGFSHKLNGLESHTAQIKELMTCTGDIETCPAHGKVDRPRWWVYHTKEQIEGLIQSLNRRGVRESELRQTLEADRANLVEYAQKCPLHMLNPIAAPPPGVPVTRHKRFPQPSLSVPPDCSLSEALELSLRDHILELEEKIFHGCLGSLKVKDREAWRGTIMVRGYDKQADYLTWGPDNKYRDDYHLPNGVINLSSELPEEDVKSIPQNTYRDPGHYLESGRGAQSPADGAQVRTGAEPGVARALASALLQVSQAVHHKYIKRPLGLDDKERKEREARNRPLDLDALSRWEVSLMECQSFSQIVLHLFTLDSSITWSASILNASCRLCRRKTDPDNMLLCDSCNKGHHLYCLKPKLTKVPDGDWFCDQCKPKERTPRKRRKLFSDEDVKENLEEESGDESGGEELSARSELCAVCGSGGELAAVCAQCGAAHHAECARPAPPRAARRWVCAACLQPARDSEDSDDNTALVKLKGRRSRSSKEASPVQNGTVKRGRKSKEKTNSSRKSKNSLTNGHGGSSERGKGRGSRVDALHADALEALLRDVMKHKDVWPFYEPVSTAEVPDYLDIIETPMDFSTIGSRLASRHYRSDSELMSDVAQVFLNCYTYNKDTHPVARAGYRLEKFINKRCAELSLPSVPSPLDAEAEAGSEASRSEASSKRSTPEDEHEAPRSKRAKLK